MTDCVSSSDHQRGSLSIASWHTVALQSRCQRGRSCRHSATQLIALCCPTGARCAGSRESLRSTVEDVILAMSLPTLFASPGSIDYGWGPGCQINNEEVELPKGPPCGLRSPLEDLFS